MPRISRSRQRSMDEHDDGRRRRRSRSERRRRSTQEKDARCVGRRSTPRSPSSTRNRRRQVEEQSPLARRQSLDRRRSGEECGTTTVSMSVADLSEAIAQGMDRMAGKLRRHTGNEQVSLSTSILNNVIAEFNPLNDDVGEWLNAVDEFATLYNWNDATTSHLALGKLRGPAENWYRGLPTKLFTWAEWRAMLLENFRPKRDLHKALQAMMQCRPSTKHTLYEYVFIKLSLIHKLKLPLSGEDQVNLIMGGIDDQQIKFAVETAGIKEPHVLATHFKSLDAIRKHPVSGISSSSVNDTPTTSIVKSRPSKTTTPQMSQNASYLSKNRHEGHDARVNLRCFACKGYGHTKRYCPGNKDNFPSSRS